MNGLKAEAAPSNVARPSPTTVNAVASIIGRGSNAVVFLLATPLYVRHMGLEQYAALGLLATLQAMLPLLDLGLNATYTRNMATAGDQGAARQNLADVARGFETVGIGLAGLGMLLALWFAHGSFDRQFHSPLQLAAFIAMTIGGQYLFLTYQAGLAGVRHQVGVNAVYALATLARHSTAIALLVAGVAGVRGVLACHATASVLQALAGRRLLYRIVAGASQRSLRSRLRIVGTQWRFAVTLGATSVLGVLLTQLDKLVLVRRVSLADFGAYALAATVAGVPALVATPIYAAVFPTFAALAARGTDGAELRSAYHRWAQVVSGGAFPLGCAVIVFAPELIGWWTHDAVLASRIAPLVRILTAGSLLMCVMVMPYALQLACGWASLGLYTNLASLVVLVPCLLAAIGRYGSLGAAFAWCALFGGQVAILIPIMHARLLPRERGRWYWNDVTVPFAISSLTMLLVHWVLAPTLTRPASGFVGVASAIAFGMALCAVASREIRAEAWLRLRAMARRRLRPDAAQPDTV